MKDEWRMMEADEGWWRMMKDDDFKLFCRLTDGQTNERTDICECNENVNEKLLVMKTSC